MNELKMNVLRKILSLSALLLIAIAVQAADDGNARRAADYIRRLSSVMESMGEYTVRFEVAAGGESIVGEYAVSGSRYHISVAGNEVYGDDEVRREIDPSKREIVVDAADTSSRNMLTNPTRAFSFLSDDYDMHLNSESGGYAVVTLRPHSGGGGGTIVVTMSKIDAQPASVRYDTDGESITIVIRELKQGARIPQFDASRYAGYETIDFR